MATRAGWAVVHLDIELDKPGTIGVVDVEGIRYSLHLGPRSRTPFIDDVSGEPVTRPVLKRCVWAEPIIDEGLLDAYP